MGPQKSAALHPAQKAQPAAGTAGTASAAGHSRHSTCILCGALQVALQAPRPLPRLLRRAVMHSQLLLLPAHNGGLAPHLVPL
jgi:hypothetical protein